jgi:peptidoglycan/xylan/chitin deacetylase (PgdA/CDA1 family)
MAVFAALAALMPRAPRMTVLLYHSVSASDDFFAVSPARLKAQIEEIQKHADIVPLSMAVSYAQGAPLQRDAVAITFDDGYRDFADNAVPIFSERNIPATVFAMGGEPDRKELGNEQPLLTAEDSHTLSHPLVTLGSHGATHRKLTKLSEADARAELIDSRKEIGRMFGALPKYFAYPKGAWNARVAGYAREAGYEAAFTVEQRAIRRGDSLWVLPRIQIDAATDDMLFKAKLTPAADMYYTLWKLFH